MIYILLSTYNGALYLEEQLQSLINQRNVDFKILVRDDGSTDKTIEILNQWQDKGLLTWYSGNNIKPCASFMHLLFNAPDADYYAFCDQDDVWFPNKLELSLHKMTSCESEYIDKPILIHTDMNVVDKDLNIISASFWKNSKFRPDILRTFKYLSVCNCVNGCTILMNNKARKLIKTNYTPQKHIIHDVISALTVSYYGGVIDYVEQPTMYYRQHSLNVVGAKKIKKIDYFQKLKNIKLLYNKNVNQIRAVNKIGRLSVFSFLYYKVKYFFIR